MKLVAIALVFACLGGCGKTVSPSTAELLEICRGPGAGTMKAWEGLGAVRRQAELATWVTSHIKDPALVKAFAEVAALPVDKRRAGISRLLEKAGIASCPILEAKDP